MNRTTEWAPAPAQNAPIARIADADFAHLLEHGRGGTIILDAEHFAGYSSGSIWGIRRELESGYWIEWCSPDKAHRVLNLDTRSWECRREGRVFFFTRSFHTDKDNVNAPHDVDKIYVICER